MQKVDSCQPVSSILQYLLMVSILDKMSGDLLLGTFGDLSKVQHQIEATLNNNVAARVEKLGIEDEDESETPSLREELSKKTKEELNDSKTAESLKSLHNVNKGTRAKMLADGYTKGKYKFTFYAIYYNISPSVTENHVNASSLA